MLSRSRPARPDDMGVAADGAVLVAGAAGALGRRIALTLAKQGYDVVAAYRTERASTLAGLRAVGCETVALDLSDVDRAADMIARADAAVLTPILAVSGPAARAALERGARRVLLFSSNNVAVDFDAPAYAALRAEEAALAETPGDWTLIRPTMIYGHAGDGNLSRLIRTARRWPVLPLPGSGAALQQPIHVDDLAALAASLLDAPDGGPRVVTAGGPEVVSLKALYEAAARAAGRGPGAVVSLPLAPLRLLARMAAGVGAPFPLNNAQLARVARDKTPAGPPPPRWAPTVTLEEGLARLAAELALSPSP